MDWMKIGWAILIVAMIAMIWPRARQMLRDSPEASSRQWMTALIPIGIVGLFIVLLVALV